MTAIRSYLTPYYHRLKTYRLPWEIGAVGAALLPYAYAMLIVTILATTMGCSAMQNGYNPEIAPLPGQAEMVFFREAMLKVEGLATGAARGMLMHNPQNNVVMFAWPHARGWAFLAIDMRYGNFLNAIRAAGSRGTYCNTADFESLIAGAQRIGYRLTTPGELLKLFPGMMTSIIETAASSATTTLPNIILVPVMPSMFDMPGAPVSGWQ